MVPCAVLPGGVIRRGLSRSEIPNLSTVLKEVRYFTTVMKEGKNQDLGMDGEQEVRNRDRVGKSHKSQHVGGTRLVSANENLT